MLDMQLQGECLRPVLHIAVTAFVHNSSHWETCLKTKADKRSHRHYCSNACQAAIESNHDKKDQKKKEKKKGGQNRSPSDHRDESLIRETSAEGPSTRLDFNQRELCSTTITDPRHDSL